MEHFLVFTCPKEGKVYMRHYLSKLLRSAEGKVPHVQLNEMGPSIDMTIRRVSPAAPDVMKAAMTRPKATAQAPKKVKNITRSKLFGKRGRIHAEPGPAPDGHRPHEGLQGRRRLWRRRRRRRRKEAAH